MVKGLITVAIDLTVALKSNLHRITGLIRGKLSLKRYANPELNLRFILSKCVETIYPASLEDDEIVRA